MRNGKLKICLKPKNEICNNDELLHCAHIFEAKMEEVRCGVGVRARQHEDRQSFAEQWCGRHVERQYWGDGERDASELN